MKTAKRNNEGKPKWSLVHFPSLEPLVEALEYGAEKYSAHGWKKGYRATEIAESLMRHLFAWLEGEDIDPESGVPHIGLIQANAMFLGYQMKFKPELDDRDKIEKHL